MMGGIEGGLAELKVGEDVYVCGQIFLGFIGVFFLLFSAFFGRELLKRSAFTCICLDARDMFSSL